MTCFALCGSIQGAELSDEQSVKPGINDNFLAADLDVSQWVERFEREGREVYDHRLKIIETIGIKQGGCAQSDQEKSL